MLFAWRTTVVGSFFLALVVVNFLLALDGMDLRFLLTVCPHTYTLGRRRGALFRTFTDRTLFAKFRPVL